MELRSGSFGLRQPVAADASVVADAVRFSMSELQVWMPWADDGYDETSAMRWINGELGDEHRFVMIDPDDRIVGSCGLNGVDHLNKRANLGYWVRSDHTGRGYATAAAALLARFGLGPAGYERLEILMAVDNEPSRRVAERIGASYEGRARRRLLLRGAYHDAYVYSVVSGDLDR